MNRIFWAIGVMLLVGTLVGVGLGFNHSPPPASVDPTPPPAVMAVGYIDGESGVSKLYPLQSGRLVKTVAEGTFVEKGEPLLWLDEELAELKKSAANADLEASLAQQMLAEKLDDQRKSKIEQQTRAINAAKLKRLAADNELKHNIEKNRDSFTLGPRLKDALEQRFQEAEELIKVEEAKLEEIKLIDPAIEKRRAAADVAFKKTRLEEAKWALDQCKLVAPSDGTVLRVHVNPGEILGPSPTRPAIEFLPKGALIVRGEVLQEWANRVKIDQDVEITDDTYQGPTFKGKVYSLSPWFTQKRNLIIEPFTYNDVRFLECLVRVAADGDLPLRVGQRVRVKIKP
jgi:HlyD family secretion protein